MTQPPSKNRPKGGRPPAIFDQAFLTDAPDATYLAFVRHGEQEFPQGEHLTAADYIDPPLSQRGRWQAHMTGMRFTDEVVDVVYASPLQRALDTGQEIAAVHKLVPIVVDDLAEVQIFHEIPRDRSPEDVVGELTLRGMHNRMVTEKSWDVYPYSEPSHAFRKRVVNAVEGIIATNEGRHIVIACHGGVINAYIGHIIGSPFDMFFRPAHTSVSVVAARGHVRALHSLNDVDHLRGSFEGLDFEPVSH